MLCYARSISISICIYVYRSMHIHIHIFINIYYCFFCNQSETIIDNDDDDDRGIITVIKILNAFCYFTWYQDSIIISSSIP